MVYEVDDVEGISNVTHEVLRGVIQERDGRSKPTITEKRLCDHIMTDIIRRDVNNEGTDLAPYGHICTPQGIWLRL